MGPKAVTESRQVGKDVTDFAIGDRITPYNVARETPPDASEGGGCADPILLPKSVIGVNMGTRGLGTKRAPKIDIFPDHWNGRDDAVPMMQRSLRPFRDPALPEPHLSRVFPLGPLKLPTARYPPRPKTAAARMMATKPCYGRTGWWRCLWWTSMVQGPHSDGRRPDRD